MQAHRVAWAVIHGRWPNGEIDHINGDRSDNRLANLREVTKRENHRNMAIRSDNTSGVTGVYWAREKGKWAAYIKADKMVALGRYDTFAEAVAARRAAEKVLGYHPNHGRR
nr:HNH endonuclease signature motif containing protein [Paracoccus homiensis]